MDTPSLQDRRYGSQDDLPEAGVTTRLDIPLDFRASGPTSRRASAPPAIRPTKRGRHRKRPAETSRTASHRATHRSPAAAPDHRSKVQQTFQVGITAAVIVFMAVAALLLVTTLITP